MFDIGWSELALIGLVALIVIGPKEMPVVMRKVAMAVRSLVVETRAETETSAAQMNYKLLALKNCAPADWREQVDHRVGGLPGAPPVATAQIDVSKLTPEQVYAYVLNGAPLPPEATKDDED